MRRQMVYFCAAAMTFAVGMGAQTLFSTAKEADEIEVGNRASLNRKVVSPTAVTLEATLIEYAPHLEGGCFGRVHDLARYRVEKVLVGPYWSQEVFLLRIKPCDENLLLRIPKGSRARLSFDLRLSYSVVGRLPWISDEHRPATVYFVTEDPAPIS